MRIIVIGAKGFLGSAIVAEANKRKHDVVPVTRQNYNELVGSTCDVLINADGNSKKYLATEDPVKDFELSVFSVIQSLQDFKAQQYIYLSSIDVYSNVSDPRENAENSVIDLPKLSTYGFHKYFAEEIVKHFAQHWLIIRMGGFVGSGQRKNSVYDMLNRKQLYVHPDSEYQYLNTRDLARILLTLIQNGLRNEIINVAGDGTISLSKIAGFIPGYAFPADSYNLKSERYEVNIRKLKTHTTVPRTEKTIKSFIENFLAGNVEIKKPSD